MATGGVSIASAGVEEEGTLGSEETAADALMQAIVDVGHRGHAAITVAPVPGQAVVARLMRPMAQQRAAAPLMAGDRMAVVSATSG